MEIAFLTALLAFVGLIALFPFLGFRKSALLDKGAIGEQRIHKRLTHFEKKGRGRLLSNIYVPRIGGGTTEIDLLLMHPKGLFVFESKNYSGWIFGNEAHKNWTQTLPKGWHGGVHKERFYNPILQNASHIEHLMYRIEKDPPVWSIIVFSDQCEFKDITVRSKNVRVVHCQNVSSTVEKICNETQIDYLTEEEIANLYNHLLTYTNASEEEKKHHAQKALEAKRRI